MTFTAEQSLHQLKSTTCRSLKSDITRFNGEIESPTGTCVSRAALNCISCANIITYSTAMLSVTVG